MYNRQSGPPSAKNLDFAKPPTSQRTRGTPTRMVPQIRTPRAYNVQVARQQSQALDPAPHSGQFPGEKNSLRTGAYATTHGGATGRSHNILSLERQVHPSNEDCRRHRIHGP